MGSAATAAELGDHTLNTAFIERRRLELWLEDHDAQRQAFIDRLLFENTAPTKSDWLRAVEKHPSSDNGSSQPG